jgi:hypothetical protein
MFVRLLPEEALQIIACSGERVCEGLSDHREGDPWG